jgi:hypothetical protein
MEELRMKMLAMAAAGATLFGSVLLLPVATEAQNTSAGIPGFLNPSTGVFTARPALEQATAALQRSGKIIVKVTATIGSNIPKTATTPLYCGVTLSSYDTEFQNYASGSAILVRSASGTTGTCSLAVPFIFEIATASTKMNVEASIYANTGSTTGSLSYSAEFAYAPFAVPTGTHIVTIPLAF